MAGTIGSTIDFYNILAKIVKAWPETVTADVYQRQKRINTFAVVPVQDKQTAHNLDKDSRYKNKTYFYSRRWELNGFKDSALNFDYPALICVENNDTIKRLFQPTATHKVKLAFFLSDLMPQKESEVTAVGEQRTFEQIGVDMRVLLTELTNEIAQFVWSRYDDGSGFSDWGWNSERWMIAEGYTIEKTNTLKSKIEETGKDIDLVPHYGYWGDNLAELPFFLTIEIVPCPTAVVFDYATNTYNKLPDDANTER